MVSPKPPRLHEDLLDEMDKLSLTVTISYLPLWEARRRLPGCMYAVAWAGSARHEICGVLCSCRTEATARCAGHAWAVWVSFPSPACAASPGPARAASP